MIPKKLHIDNVNYEHGEHCAIAMFSVFFNRIDKGSFLRFQKVIYIYS